MDESIAKLIFWNEVEATHCATGIIPENPALALYRARFQDFDAKKAEALQLDRPGTFEALEKVRTDLMAGNFEQADQLLRRTYEHARANAGYRVQALLELARLSAFRGKWAEAESLCSEALSEEDDCPGATRMTLLQVRAIARVELGHFKAAEQDLGAVEALVRLYPFGNPGIYGEATRIRLLARSGRGEEARRALDQCWKPFAKRTPNVDELLTLFRAELCIVGAQAENALDLSIGSYLIAEAISERLYIGLAWADVTRCFDSLDDRSSALVKSWSDRYERVAHEAQDTAAPRGSLPKTALKRVHDGLLHAESLLLPRQGLVVHLKPKMSVSRIDLQPQVVSGLKAIAEQQHIGPLEKKKLFESIWPGRFAPHLHDSIVRTLLRRIRAQTGVSILTREGSAELEKTWIVRCLN